MTTIAWDGYSLSADKRSVNNTVISTVTKCRKISNKLVAGAGAMDTILAMFNWIENGENPETFPSCQQDENLWSPILIITEDKRILKYERTPHPIEYEDNFFAIGSGRDFALCAMHLGKTSKEAIEIASKFDASTGNGVDTLSFDECSG